MAPLGIDAHGKLLPRPIVAAAVDVVRSSPLTVELRPID